MKVSNRLFIVHGVGTSDRYDTRDTYMYYLWYSTTYEVEHSVGRGTGTLERKKLYAGECFEMESLKSF